VKAVFETWIDRWSLVAAGPPIHTAYSDLLPVVRDGAPAMLKVARTSEEHRGASRLDRGRLLKWVVAYAGLSAAWCLEDGEDAALPLAVMRLASERSMSS